MREVFVLKIMEFLDFGEIFRDAERANNNITSFKLSRKIHSKNIFDKKKRKVLYRQSIAY